MIDAQAEDDKRRFGYHVLGVKQYIPYIFHDGKEFCATKMFQWHIDQLNIKLNPTLSLFPFLMGLEMSRSEAMLYNEINQWHNDRMYPYEFRENDTMVKLNHVCDIYKFVMDCDLKTKWGERHEMGAGLVEIKCTAPAETDETAMLRAVWPYILKNEKRYVPIEFVADATSTLSATIVLDGIDVMYMRYLYIILKCPIQKSETKMPCVELDDALAQTLSATDVTYEYDENYWPTKKRSQSPNPTPLPMLLGSHIKKLNNNNLAFFAQTPAKPTNRVEKASKEVTTENVPATKIAAKSAKAKDDNDENAEKENQKISSRKRQVEKGSTTEGNDRKRKAATSKHFYEVEDLIDFKVVRNKEMVLVRWKGYSKEHDSWEPVAHMNDGLDDDVDKLREKHREKTRRNKKH